MGADPIDEEKTTLKNSIEDGNDTVTTSTASSEIVEFRAAEQATGTYNESDSKLVSWSGPDDPENPLNFPVWKKWAITICMASVTLVVTFASSVFSTATLVTAEEFNVSAEVMILGTSLFVLVLPNPTSLSPYTHISNNSRVSHLGRWFGHHYPSYSEERLHSSPVISYLPYSKFLWRFRKIYIPS